MTSEEVLRIRTSLHMNPAEFAKLLCVDTRTISRWEGGIASPSGTAEAFLIGMQEVLIVNPHHKDEIVKFTKEASAVGGITYLLLKLMELQRPLKVPEDSPYSNFTLSIS